MKNASRGGMKKLARKNWTSINQTLIAWILILLSSSATSAAANDPRALNLSLLDAAKQGDAALVASALNDGASVNTRDRFGNTALIYAARSGHIKTTRVLIEAGADANQASVSGNTPLFEAAGSGNIELVQLFLQLGIAPNIVNMKNVSPLANAIFHKRSDIATLLLQRGARPDITDSTGKSSTVYAAANGETAILDRILEMSNEDASSVDVRYTHNLTLLMWAAGYGNADTVAMLIGRGAKIDLTDDRGKTALIMAAETGISMSLLNYSLQVPIQKSVTTTVGRHAITPKLQGIRNDLVFGLAGLSPVNPGDYSNSRQPLRFPCR